jgi:uncharacterized membrane protein
MPDPRPSGALTSARRRRRAAHSCGVCKASFSGHSIIPTSSIRENVASRIAARVADWDATGFICPGCLNRFRAEFVRAEMEKDRGELSALEEEVMKSLREGEIVADDINQEFDRGLTLGERTADKVAEFGGSWRFIFIFFGVMIVWIIVNSIYLLWAPFDPYPYILLNLALSLLAAIQAPVIMMSQNRQEARDRMRAENDYKVNLKAELEVRAISDKLDQLIHHQWEHLLEIQQIQMEMIDDLVGPHRARETRAGDSVQDPERR